MRTALRAEFRKGLLKASFLRLLTLVLLVNGFLLLRLAPEFYPRTLHRQVWSYLETLPEDEALSYVQARAAELGEKQLSGYHPGLDAAHQVFTNLKRQADELPAFHERVARMQASPTGLARLRGESDFERESRAMTAAAFAKFSDTRLPFVNVTACEYGLSWRLGDLGALLLLLVLVDRLFFCEKEEGQLQLLYPLRRGRGFLMRRKIAVLCAASFALALLFALENQLLSALLFGRPALGAPLQVIPAYRGSSFALSVGAYLLLQVGLKGLGLFFLSLCALFLAQLALRRTTLWLSFTLFVAISSLLRLLLSARGPLAALRYFNAYFLSDADAYCRLYYHLDLFGRPLPVHHFALILLPLATGALCALNLLRFARRYPSVQRGKGESRRRGRVSVSLFAHEQRKLLLVQRGWVLLLALLAVQLCFHLLREPEWNQSDAIYRQYCAQFSTLDAEARQEAVAAEAKRLHGLRTEYRAIETALARGETDPFTADLQRMGLAQQLSVEPAFQRVLAYHQRVEAARRFYGLEGRLLYDTGYREFIGLAPDGAAGDLWPSLLFALGLILLFSNYCADDVASGMVRLSDTCKLGRDRLLRVQLRLGAGYTALVLLLAYAPGMVEALLRRSLPDFWRAAMLPVAEWPLRDAALPYWLFVGMVLLGRYLAGCILVLLCFLLGRHRGRAQVAIVALSLVFCLPLYLSALGWTLVDGFSLNRLFSPAGFYLAHPPAVFFMPLALLAGACFLRKKLIQKR